MDCSLEDMINHFLFRVAFGHGIHHGNRKITRMEIDTREQDISVMDFSVLFGEDCGSIWSSQCFMGFSVAAGKIRVLRRIQTIRIWLVSFQKKV